MTTRSPTAATHVLPPRYSHARRWDALRAFVHDALADAMHHHAAMQGAQPASLTLLLSRLYLPDLSPEQTQHQVEVLSADLRRLGVPHAIHQVVPGDAEPALHQLRITLERP